MWIKYYFIILFGRGIRSMEVRMIKVITYGTYDLLHYGHIRLLERAKELGDYLIVGVTADDFDKTRGKINVQQSLMERIEAVKGTGLADEIIIEEYEGQKIDDIRRYDIDIFTIGSDWKGKFDYIGEYCKVIYLDRTQGISSSELRSKKRCISLGLVGKSEFLNKFLKECSYVNGVKIVGVCSDNIGELTEGLSKLPIKTKNYDKLLENVEAVFIHSYPAIHYKQIKKALDHGKHVLCESPLALKKGECSELFEMAKEKNLVLVEALRTAYSTAYTRLLLLIKSGIIGDVISVDATCTSLREVKGDLVRNWNSIASWGPTAMLPVFQILGTKYLNCQIISHYLNKDKNFDLFSKISFVFNRAVASVKVGSGVKSEGELIISGTKGYVFVPAPWWKTEYFEIRYENPSFNKRYFYQLEGEGIRYEMVAFLRCIKKSLNSINIEREISETFSQIMEEFEEGKNVIELQ